MQRALTERIGRCAFPEQFGEVLVPTEEVVETRNNRRYVTERRMYAGYVLVHMVMNDDTWHLVKNTPRVTGFLGGNRPAALADHEIAAILQTQEATAENRVPRLVLKLAKPFVLKKVPLPISMVALKKWITIAVACVSRLRFLVVRHRWTFRLAA